MEDNYSSNRLEAGLPARSQFDEPFQIEGNISHYLTMDDEFAEKPVISRTGGQARF